MPNFFGGRRRLLKFYLSPMFIMFLCACSTWAIGGNKKTSDEAFSVYGRMYKLQGACSSIGCANIQYEVEVFEIKKSNGRIVRPDIEKSSLSVCGKSGLTLGKNYQFIIKQTIGKKINAADRPLTFNGDFATCDYYFDKAIQNLSGDLPTP